MTPPSPPACRSFVTLCTSQPSAFICSSDHVKSGRLSVLKHTSPPIGRISAYIRRKFGDVSRCFASRLFGHGSQKLTKMRSTSPGANTSRSFSASIDINRTLPISSAQARSMAMTMASSTFSRAISSAPGFSFAVPTVKRPLPQPISSHRLFPGKLSRHFPRSAAGSAICTAAHFSMRGCRFGFFLIRIYRSLSEALSIVKYHTFDKTSIRKSFNINTFSAKTGHFLTYNYLKT